MGGTGVRVVLGSNPAAATSLRNFGGDTKSRRSLLSNVYMARKVGPKIPHQSAREMYNLSCTPPHLENDKSKNNPVYNTQL